MRLCSNNDNELQTIFDRMKKELCETNMKSLGNFGNVLRLMSNCDDAEK